MIDPVTFLADSITVLSVIASCYTATAAILKSHANLAEKIDGLVGVVSSHQVGIDTISKDVELLKVAGLKK